MQAQETGIYLTFITGLIILTILLIIFIISIIRHQRLRIRNYKNQIIREIGLIEEERKRIAADLHDDLGSILSAVRLQIESFEETNPDNRSLSKTLRHIDYSIIRLKEISHNLMPAILQEKGLFAALEELIADIRHTNKIKLIVKDSGEDESFQADKTILIFRIIQEVLTNAIKHAKASEIKINYATTIASLNIEIWDNGIGFQIEPNKGGIKKFGLQNIRSRLELLNAKYILTSSGNKGTRYQIEIPLSSLYQKHEKNNAN